MVATFLLLCISACDVRERRELSSKQQELHRLEAGFAILESDLRRAEADLVRESDEKDRRFQALVRYCYARPLPIAAAVTQVAGLKVLLDAEAEKLPEGFDHAVMSAVAVAASVAYCHWNQDECSEAVGEVTSYVRAVERSDQSVRTLH